MTLSASKTWWPGTELNRRRQPFQGCALPPELPGHVLAHSLSAGAVRLVWHASTWMELPVNSGSQTLEACGTEKIIATEFGSLKMAAALWVAATRCFTLGAVAL